MTRPAFIALVAFWPATVFAQAQFTAEDIVRHFAKSNAPEELDRAPSRGVVIGGSNAATQQLDMTALNRQVQGAPAKPAAQGSDLVIPMTGIARQDSDTPPQQTTVAAAAQPGTPATPVNAEYDLLITFEVNSDQLTSQARRNLDEFARALTLPALASARFLVEGHTDATGPANANLTLSRSRAKSVVAYLKGKGIAGGRLSAEGYGETRPLHTNPDDPRNRRVQTRRLR